MTLLTTLLQCLAMIVFSPVLVLESMVQGLLSLGARE